jgi:hypothetical protein
VKAAKYRKPCGKKVGAPQRKECSSRACLFFIPVGFIALQWMTMQPAILMIGHLISLACAGFFLATHRK